MKHIVIAPFDGDLGAILDGIKESSTEKIVLITPLSSLSSAGPSLINYHIYGNEKNPGLKELGLVEIERNKGRVEIRLASLGKLLLKQRSIEF